MLEVTSFTASSTASWLQACKTPEDRRKHTQIKVSEGTNETELTGQ